MYAEDVDYVVENGRQYCGDYFLPIDQTEQTRQYVVHQVYLKLFDLELTTVALENPRYILDVGTGIGEWAIGMAERYPECEVFGTDIAPIQPTQQVPFNVEFHIENAEEEWIRPADAVDLVHIRDMAGAFSDWSFIYQQAFVCIRPGGWIEILDFDDFYAEKNMLSFYPPNAGAHILVRGLYDASQRLGRPRDVSHMRRELLTDVGFVDIDISVHEIGVGERENSSYGNFWLFAILTGMEATCMRTLTKGLGWDAEYVRVLCARVAQETKALADDPTRPRGFATKLRVLRGRKPALASSGPWTTRVSGENGEVQDCTARDDHSTIGNRSHGTLRGDETT